jgi:hypothetical protein
MCRIGKFLEPKRNNRLWRVKANGFGVSSQTNDNILILVCRNGYTTL